MYNHTAQETRPPVSDTFHRTSTESSNTVLLWADQLTLQSYDNSRYLTQEEDFQELRRKLDRLVDKPLNWDSYGSEAPSQTAIQNSRSILSLLRAKLLQPEKVLASADGGVAIAFVAQTISRAAIESLNTGESYVLLYDLNGNSQTHDWPESSTEQSNLIDRLAAHLRSKGLATNR